MKVIVATITTRAGKAKLAGISSLVDEYLNRGAQYCKIEVHNCISEEEFFAWTERRKSRTAPFIVLLDSRGKQSSSEEFAAFIERHRSGASQELIFAIGSADGWSKDATMRCNLLLSFGKVTLPHELAKVVLLEQIYRAFAILNHHPYHGGH